MVKYLFILLAFGLLLGCTTQNAPKEKITNGNVSNGPLATEIINGSITGGENIAAQLVYGNITKGKNLAVEVLVGDINGGENVAVSFLCGNINGGKNIAVGILNGEINTNESTVKVGTTFRGFECPQ